MLISSECFFLGLKMAVISVHFCLSNNIPKTHRYVENINLLFIDVEAGNLISLMCGEDPLLRMVPPGKLHMAEERKRRGAFYPHWQKSEGQQGNFLPVL